MSLHDISIKHMLRPDGPLISLWSIIKDGSAEVEFSQDEKIGSLLVYKDSVVMDICDTKRAGDLLMALSPNNPNDMLAIGGGGGDSKNKSEKKDEPGVGELLDLLQDTADALNDAGKTMVLRFRGEDVLRAGNCRTCTTMRILGHRNMEIVSMVLLAKLATSFLLG